jgi:hypothetical protein
MKNQKKKNTEIPPRVIALGNFNVKYSLDLTNEEIKKFGYENLNDINTIEELSFLLTFKYLWNKIKLITDNNLIDSFLFINNNLTSENNKAFYEFVCLENPIYTEEEKKYEEMFDTVNQLNILFLNKNPVYKEKSRKITLILKNNDQSKEFVFGNGIYNNELSYKEKESKPEKNSSDNKKDDKKEEKKEEENKEKEEKLFTNITLNFKAYDYFICFLDELLDINPLQDLIDFITEVKLTYNANIIIKYKDVTSKFPDSNSMMKLNRIFLLTDTFLLESQSTLSNFSHHYSLLGTKKKKNGKMEENDIKDYFIHTIACGGELSMNYSKIAFLLNDNISKITMIEVPMGIKSTYLNYDIKPFPKVNHTNVNLVEKYKNALKENIEYLKMIFFCSILSKLFFNKNKNKGIGFLYTCYIVSDEVIKRTLELKVNNAEIPKNSKYYSVKINKSEIDEYVKKLELEKKEGKFILDCTNIEKSKMKFYVPLFDENLKAYFKNQVIHKDLVNKGFINKKGFINYDPYYRDSMKEEKKRAASKEGGRVGRFQNVNKEKERVLKSVSPQNRKLISEKNKKPQTKKNVKNKK